MLVGTIINHNLLEPTFELAIEKCCCFCCVATVLAEMGGLGGCRV